MTRLIKRHNLTFKRFGVSVTDRYGIPREGDPTLIETEGNLQPYKSGQESLSTPEGMKLRGCFVYYTKTPLNAVDNYNNTPPDEVDLEGIKYEAYSSEPWQDLRSKTSHYKVVLKKKGEADGD